MKKRRKKQPCDRDCPKRTDICHSICPDYLEYYAIQRKANADDLRKGEADGYLADEIRKKKKSLDLRKWKGANKPNE